MKKVSIIIPTLNEAKNLKELIPKLDQSLKRKKIGYEILIIDDDSQDETKETISELKKHHNISIKVRKNKKGLSSAVMYGFDIAKGKILGVMDADLSHSPEDMLKLIETIEKGNYDMVIGSRFIKGGKCKKWAIQRKIISYIARMMVKPITKVNDPLSGLFLIRKETIKDADLRPMGYKIGLEILMTGNIKKVKEVPIDFTDRKNGKSKLKIKTITEFVLQLPRFYLRKSLK